MKLPITEPCAERRGMTDNGGRNHYCMICGRWAVFGYGVAIGKPGKWYCREHRPVEESAPAPAAKKDLLV